MSAQRLLDVVCDVVKRPGVPEDVRALLQSEIDRLVASGESTIASASGVPINAMLKSVLGWAGVPRDVDVVILSAQRGEEVFTVMLDHNLAPIENHPIFIMMSLTAAMEHAVLSAAHQANLIEEVIVEDAETPGPRPVQDRSQA